jgi:hypothetical protein
MSGIQANVLKLYNVGDDKKFEMKVEGDYTFMKYYTAGDVPANDVFHSVSMPKVSVDGVGDVSLFVNENRTKGLANETSIATESAARSSADVVLQSNIDSEAATARANEQANASLIGAETSNRVSGDATIQAALDSYKVSNDSALATESATRISRDSAIEAKSDANTVLINSNKSALDSKDNELDGKITQNKADATAEVQVVQANLDSYKTTNDAVTSSLQSQITNLLDSSPEHLNQLSELVADYNSSDQGLDARISQLEAQVQALLDFHS